MRVDEGRHPLHLLQPVRRRGEDSVRREQQVSKVEAEGELG